MLRYTVILSTCIIYAVSATDPPPCTEGQKTTAANCACGGAKCTQNQYCYVNTTQHCFDMCTDKINVTGGCQCGTAPNPCLQGSYCESNSCLVLCKPNATTDTECQCGTVKCNSGDVCDSAKSSTCSKPPTTNASDTTVPMSSTVVTTTTPDSSGSEGYGAGIVFCK